jgi:hypothetical protein
VGGRFPMFNLFKAKVKDEVKEEVKQPGEILRTKEEILTELKQTLKNYEGLNVGKNYICMDKDYNFQEYELDKSVNKVNNESGQIVDNKIWGEKLSLEQLQVILDEYANKIYEEEKRIKEILDYLDS